MLHFSKQLIFSKFDVHSLHSLKFWKYSESSISRSWWDYFLQVQITRSANLFGLVKKSPTPNYGWRKQSKCIFDSNRRFELAEFEISEFEIIEIRLYDILLHEMILYVKFVDLYDKSILQNIGH